MHLITTLSELKITCKQTSMQASKLIWTRSLNGTIEEPVNQSQKVENKLQSAHSPAIFSMSDVIAMHDVKLKRPSNREVGFFPDGG